MSQIAKTFTLSACALAASLLISACGGGTGVIDNVPPTVDIVGSLGATPGTVEFKFTFSEDVGQSFVVEDVVVVGDKKAATLTRTNATQYTLVVTPNAAGTFKATVPIGKFQDIANNANTTEYSSLPFIYTTTADTTKPTVGITSVVNTNGTVTLTYTFSEGVTGFNKDDVVVSSGTKADVVKSASDPKVYTQVITPGTTDQTLTISIPAGAFTDLATTPNANEAVGPKTINIDSSVSLMSFEGTSATPYAFGLGTGYAKIELEPGVTNSTNKVLTVQKAGTTATTTGGVVLSTVAGVESDPTKQIIAPAVTLTGLNKTVTMRVKSPGVAVKVLLKFENTAGGTPIEVAQTTTTSTDWQTLTFDFTVTNDVTYNKMTVFPDFGGTTERTFYIDDIKLIPAPSTALVTMDESTFTAGAFGKATAEMKTETVNGLPNKVIEVINPVGAEDWAGIVLGFKTVTIGAVVTPIITTDITESALKATNLKWTMRVFSPAKDIPVRIKLEDVRTLDGIVYDPNNVNLHRVEVDVKTTVANAWEVLTFDFSKVNAGTPAFRPDYAYNKVVVFFNADQKKTATQTFRCDDLRVLN
jgi:Bacterial Ig-like domain